MKYLWRITRLIEKFVKGYKLGSEVGELACREDQAVSSLRGLVCLEGADKNELLRRTQEIIDGCGEDRRRLKKPSGFVMCRGFGIGYAFHKPDIDF